MSFKIRENLTKITARVFLNFLRNEHHCIQQKRIYDPVKYLEWSFFHKNNIFLKKLYHRCYADSKYTSDQSDGEIKVTVTFKIRHGFSHSLKINQKRDRRQIPLLTLSKFERINVYFP